MIYRSKEQVGETSKGMRKWQWVSRIRAYDRLVVFTPFLVFVDSWKYLRHWHGHMRGLWTFMIDVWSPKEKEILGIADDGRWDTGKYKTLKCRTIWYVCDFECWLIALNIKWLELTDMMSCPCSVISNVDFGSSIEMIKVNFLQSEINHATMNHCRPGHTDIQKNRVTRFKRSTLISSLWRLQRLLDTKYEIPTNTS